MEGAALRSGGGCASATGSTPDFGLTRTPVESTEASAQFPLSGYHPDARCTCGPPEIGVGRCQRQIEAHRKRQVGRVVVGQTVLLREGWQFEKFGWRLLGSVNGKALSRVRNPSI